MEDRIQLRDLLEKWTEAAWIASAAARASHGVRKALKRYGYLVGHAEGRHAVEFVHPTEYASRVRAVGHQWAYGIAAKGGGVRWTRVGRGGHSLMDRLGEYHSSGRAEKDTTRLVPSLSR